MKTETESVFIEGKRVEFLVKAVVTGGGWAVGFKAIKGVDVALIIETPETIRKLIAALDTSATYAEEQRKKELAVHDS